MAEIVYDNGAWQLVKLENGQHAVRAAGTDKELLFDIGVNDEGKFSLWAHSHTIDHAVTPEYETYLAMGHSLGGLYTIERPNGEMDQGMIGDGIVLALVERIEDDPISLLKSGRTSRVGIFRRRNQDGSYYNQVHVGFGDFQDNTTHAFEAFPDRAEIISRNGQTGATTRTTFTPDGVFVDGRAVLLEPLAYATRRAGASGRFKNLLSRVLWKILT